MPCSCRDSACPRLLTPADNALSYKNKDIEGGLIIRLTQKAHLTHQNWHFSCIVKVKVSLYSHVGECCFAGWGGVCARVCKFTFMCIKCYSVKITSNS